MAHSAGYLAVCTSRCGRLDGGGVSARTDVCKDVGKGSWDDKLKLRVPPGCPKEPLLVQVALLDKDDAAGEAAHVRTVRRRWRGGGGGGG